MIDGVVIDSVVDVSIGSEALSSSLALGSRGRLLGCGGLATTVGAIGVLSR